MDFIIYLIFLLLIIGIILLSKNYLIREGLGFGTINSISSSVIKDEEDEDDDDDEENLQPKFEGGYEIVGSVPPPSYKDAIYDFNLKYATDVWKELGCNPQSQYAPTVDNKENLFGDKGWASEEYDSRVKSMSVEANKAEYNYYDWGKYKKSKENSNLVTNKETQDADKWVMNEDKMGIGWKEKINRPVIVKYPLGMRKAKALCHDDGTGKGDQGDYNFPKRGDKVKIKETSSYDSPYFAGIYMTKIPSENEEKKGEVLWYQKGIASVDSTSNKIINNVGDETCGTGADYTDKKDKCTRDTTKDTPIEVTVDWDNKDGRETIGWKLFGIGNKNGGNGQKDWFGWPNIIDDTTIVDKNKWSKRHLNNIEHIIPTKLKTFANEKNTIYDDGKVNSKSVFKINECQELSSCEDLRCDAIVNKIKQKYPLTHVCNIENKNTLNETHGQYCEKGTNKGATFNYYSENLCAFQDYGEPTWNEKELIITKGKTRNFCKKHCGSQCKDISKLPGGWKTGHYAEVFNGRNYTGAKAIVRGIDGPMLAKNLFPDQTRQYIVSFKLYGQGCVAMVKQGGGAIIPVEKNEISTALAINYDSGKGYCIPNKANTCVPENRIQKMKIKKGVNPHGGGKSYKKSYSDEVANCAKLSNQQCSSGNGGRCNDSKHMCRDMTNSECVKSSECTYNTWKTQYGYNQISQIEICKKHTIPANNTPSFPEIIQLPTPGKLKYLSIADLKFYDQGYGGPTNCIIKAGGGTVSIDGTPGRGKNYDYDDTLKAKLKNIKSSTDKINALTNEINKMSKFTGVNAVVVKPMIELLKGQLNSNKIHIIGAGNVFPKTNSYNSQLYSLTGNNVINKIEINKPSHFDSSHSVIYLGRGAITLYYSLK